MGNAGTGGQMVTPPDETTADLRAVIATLRQQLAESVAERDAAVARDTKRDSDYAERAAHQGATVEVLQAMAASPGDPKPVFELIVRRARDLCDGYGVSLAQVVDSSIVLRASVVADEALAKRHEASFPRPVAADTLFGRAILAREPVQIPNVAADENLALREVTLRSAVRASAAVPLMRDGEAIGAIDIARRQTGEFSPAQIELLQVFADQAVIAINSAETHRALQGRTSDLQEALERQTATADVLGVINANPGDLAPVFDAILDKALRLCDSAFGVFSTYNQSFFHIVAARGVPDDPDGFLQRPHKPLPGLALTRIVLGEDVVQIADITDDEAYRQGIPDRRFIADVCGGRTQLLIALRKDKSLLGMFNIFRREVRPFSDRQIELLRGFAAQAVIAMENARLLTEQREALERQTATAEVLGVINANPGNLAPVFDTILEKAHALCGAAFGSLFTFDGERFRSAAHRNVPAAYAEYRERNPPKPVPGSGIFRLLQTKRPVQDLDMMSTEAYRAGHANARAMVELGGIRTIAGVPLLKDDALVGMISMFRQEVQEFSDKQIALLESFAAQAVIAMENARLINETREALEQQTATAEVLQVINASPGNLVPVFDAILNKAHALCGATMGNLTIYKDGYLQVLATHGHPEEIASLLRQPYRPNPATQCLIDGQRFHQIEDLRAIEISDPVWSERPLTRALITQTDVRTILLVPLRKDGALLGLITAHRPEVRPFSEKEIALLENFAAQAVIAMENARLLTEQREALEQQTATAEVLQVINASSGNLKPVFDAILKKAHILCGAEYGVLLTYDGERFWPVAVHGDRVANSDSTRHGIRPGFGFGRLVRGERFLHIHDMAEVAAEMPDDPVPRALLEISGIRTQLAVPLRRDDKLLGIITANRREVRPFAEKEITLLENFAAQAVIAMENARLLTEQREALEQQTATAEVLGVINSSPGNLMPVFDAILERAHTVCDAPLGSLVLYDGEQLRAVATRGYPQEYETLARQGFSPTPPFRQLVSGEPFVHVPDTATWPVPPNAEDELMRRAAIEIARISTALFVPLRKDRTVLGYISAQRQEKRPFTDKQIALLDNFAAQAVIAMENARLITEQSEALEQQTATAEVLQVINSSPGDLAPVFDALLDKAMRLCGAAFGSLYTYDGERFHSAAQRGVPPAYAAYRAENPPLLSTPGGAPAVLLETRRPLHVLDMRVHETNRPDFPNVRAMVELGGIRTSLAVPLIKDDAFLGFITIYRQEVCAFSDKQIALLENFAAQAVIAMENARLLDEIRQRQEELRVTFENMGDGVALYDETQHLVAWNRKFQDTLDVPDEVIARRQTFHEYVRYLADRGEYGAGPDVEEQVRRLTEQARAGQYRAYERTRPNGRVIEIRHNPVPDGGFVLIFSDITERKRNEAEIRAARDTAEEASRTIEAAYRDLKAAQASLIQAEKMASLGQLTAGIAHEIKNPLNFVNNFSDLSRDLLDELNAAVAPERVDMAADLRSEIDDLCATLKGNLAKIAEHGRRADSIVKNMLLHSRSGPSEHRLIDLSSLVEEALNLAYHGARAETPGFNIVMEKQLDPAAGMVEVFPQDITRVLLNLIGNGFYAARKRADATQDKNFEPTLRLTTRNLGNQVEIRIRDNGIGISEEVRDRIFEPFFTTKPAGEGTGLGLSLSFDIIVKLHGGQLTVDSRPNEFTEFQIILPRRFVADEGVNG
jgi:GAF domain-containing protein/nitrogen-specific signal transduction histidine kinase